MANKLKVQEQEAIVRLARQGWAIRRIARQLGISRNTVREYLRRAENSPPPVEGGKGEGVGPPGAQTDPLSTAGNTGRPSLCSQFGAWIGEQVEAGLSAQRIYQDLREQFAFGGSYESVKRFVRKLRQSDPQRVWRIEVQPGEEVQVDFGAGPGLALPEGRRGRCWIFRMVLSHSRKAYSEAVRRQDTESFLRCLENAFRHFGGVAQTVNLDNLKAAVLKCDWADPRLNPKLADFARHYGTAILPCLPRTPQHKGKVERSIQYVKDNALAGRRFTSLAEVNEHLARWEASVADQRIHGTTCQQVARRFEAEKPFLQPLPGSLFPVFREGVRKVHRDGYVEVEKAFYHVPPEYLGHQLWVRYDGREVRIFTRDRDGLLEQIQLHRRLEPGQFTQVRGIGGGHGALQANLQYWQRRAEGLGSSCARWAQGAVEKRGIEAMRSLMGLVALADKHSFAALNRACERAAASGAWSLRAVRQQLESREIQNPLPFEENHPLIRELSEYEAFLQKQIHNQSPLKP